MEEHNEQVVRDRAYTLWVEAGSPEGDDQRFWHEAERQLSNESEFDTSEEEAEGVVPPLPAGLPNL